MLFVTRVFGSLEISWQKISSDDLQGLNGVSPSIDGLLKKDWNFYEESHLKRFLINIFTQFEQNL